MVGGDFEWLSTMDDSEGCLAFYFTEIRRNVLVKLNSNSGGNEVGSRW